MRHSLLSQLSNVPSNMITVKFHSFPPAEIPTFLYPLMKLANDCIFGSKFWSTCDEEHTSKTIQVCDKLHSSSLPWKKLPFPSILWRFIPTLLLLLVSAHDRTFSLLSLLSLRFHFRPHRSLYLPPSLLTEKRKQETCTETVVCYRECRFILGPKLQFWDLISAPS